MVPVVVGATIDHAVVTGDAGALALWLAILAVTFAVLIVILDEATAEAGSTGARALEAAADAALEGRTALVVAGGAYAELWSAWSGARPA
jgi:ATP-binding cassette subfamily C protein